MKQEDLKTLFWVLIGVLGFGLSSLNSCSIENDTSIKKEKFLKEDIKSLTRMNPESINYKGFTINLVLPKWEIGKVKNEKVDFLRNERESIKAVYMIKCDNPKGLNLINWFALHVAENIKLNLIEVIDKKLLVAEDERICILEYIAKKQNHVRYSKTMYIEVNGDIYLIECASQNNEIDRNEINLVFDQILNSYKILK